ncbi:MAG: hypothetical protein ACOYB2_10415 [Limnohabitans sp.]
MIDPKQGPIAQMPPDVVRYACVRCGADVASKIEPDWSLTCPQCKRVAPAADYVPENELRALAGDR